MCIIALKIIPCKWSNCDAFFLYFRGILSPTLQCDRLVSMDSAKMRQLLRDSLISLKAQLLPLDTYKVAVHVCRGLSAQGVW
jgi:hypothetical protein